MNLFFKRPEGWGRPAGLGEQAGSRFPGGLDWGLAESSFFGDGAGDRGGECKTSYARGAIGVFETPPCPTASCYPSGQNAQCHHHVLL